MDLIWMAATLVFAFSLLAAVFWIATGLLGAPWVPTASETVNMMLTAAGVKPNEVVYDLGSGDGRIVVAAAKSFHARSVGIELNPLWVLWTRLKVAILGLGGRTKVVWGNFFSVDIGEADVVTIYLLQSTNYRLESKLKKELKPGSRVVSHVFTFNDWNPVRVDTKLQIYLYVVKD